MTPRPAPGLVLCRLDEIADPGMGFPLPRRATACSPASWCAGASRSVGYVDSCPHAGGPLALIGDRYLTREKDLILCSTHGPLFRPEDGGVRSETPLRGRPAGGVGGWLS